MQYQGFVYTDSPENSRIPASFELNGSRLVYRVEGQVFETDLASAGMESGGFDHTMLYITPEAGPHRTLLLSDRGILNELVKNPDARISGRAQALSGKFGRKKKWRIFGVGIVIAFFLVIGLAIFGTGFNSWMVRLVPVEWDKKLGEYAYPSAVASMAPGAPKVENRLVTDALEKIRSRLYTSLAQSGTQFTYEITILESPIQNAFALPGGKIVVFTGLLKKAESPEEVAGVLAHEIMHVENRHTMQQIIRKLGIVAVFNVLLGDIEGVAGIVIGAGSELLTLGYSRSMEIQADTHGFKLLAKSGIDAQGMIDFFQKLSKDEKAMKPFEILSTHPMSEKRADFLIGLKKKYPLEKSIPLGINWSRVKNSLR